jgi:hypothetical protein
MTTIIFIHGTGTRGSNYTETLSLVKTELTRTSRRSDLRIVPCYWGEPYGSRLHQDGASIPLYDSTRSPEAVASEEEALVLWEMLYQDPLYELRTLVLGTTGSASFVPGQLPPGDQLKTQVAALQPSTDLKMKLSAAGIDTQFEEAKQLVTISTPYLDALSTATPPLNPYRTAIARAIMAQAIDLCAQQQVYARIAYDAWMRDAIVEQVADAIGPSERGFGRWAAKQLFGLALRMSAMNHVQRQRGAITDAVFPFAGDILLYQARGDHIRAFIRDCIKESSQQDPNVVLLAHSLGGIACVDLLVLEPLPEVKLLVTVGSQAPFLYELGALYSLSYGQHLPSHFPTWLNIYDLRDFLSYIGANVFPNRVQDVLVDSKQPFPHAHGAYWTNPATWKAIVGRLP